MPKAAVIDLGTNTFKLGLYEVREDNSFVRLSEEERFVKLGLKQIGHITPDVWDRAMTTLTTFHDTITAQQINTIIAAGTEGLRKAGNAQEFIGAVKTELGLDIQILSGDDEAKLTVLGIQPSISDWDAGMLMDIGGGSTEFAVLPKGEAASFPMGAAALHLALTKEKPGNMSRWLWAKADELAGLWVMENKPLKETPLAGTSGSFESIAEMLYYPYTMEHLPPGKSYLEVTAQEVSELQQTLSEAPLEERLEWPGLNPERADYIIPAITLVTWAMDRLGADTLRIIKYGLKEGLLRQYLNGA